MRYVESLDLVSRIVEDLAGPRRAVADRLIVESHFQLDGFTKFARGARAILDGGIT